MGILLKPNNYKKEYWRWLIQRVKRRIINWFFRFLSLGGILVLENYFLQIIHVYWFSYAMVQRSVLEVIRKIMFKFICVGNLNSSKFHLTSWQSISLPKKMVGWGLKHFFWFGDALGVKTLWRDIFGHSLCHLMRGFKK